MVPGLRKYSCEFSLDPNTAHRELLLSEDKRSVRRVKEQLCPRHEDRFMDQPQVLSCTGLRGRCYWEVEWRRGDVDVAVSYRGIRRRGESCRFGDNDRSWSLRFRGGALRVCHNGKETRIYYTYSYSSLRLGVFLDSEAGILSFYQILSDDKPLHLHTVSCSFTKPLFPGFSVTTGKKQYYTHIYFFHLDWECSWILRMELCPSMMSVMVNSSTFTPSSALSLS
uniref:B30.2/SPRY domain-containing protein n=1 Tax=Neogobius melanostomus TaxID=47308 RepID=A0A8C6SME2_9GOBI